MSLFNRPEGNERAFNNADDFSMAFDIAWKKSQADFTDKEKDLADKIDNVMDQISDHPFLKCEPKLANEIAKFRIRLLKLD